MIANRNVANYGLVSKQFGNDIFRPILKWNSLGSGCAWLPTDLKANEAKFAFVLSKKAT